MRFIIVLLIACLLCLPGTVVYASQGLKKAVFLRPDKADSFWDLLESAMRAACDDLGISLKVVEVDEDPFRLVQNVRAMARSDDRPDMVFFEAHSRISLQVFRALDEAGIDMFTLNTAVPEEILEETGGPRARYKHWIGRMNPDDYAAGRDIAEFLYQTLKKKNASSIANIVAVQGVARVSPSDTRLSGLEAVVTAHDDLRLLAIGEGYWRAEPTRKVVETFVKKYPDLRGLWMVNDDAALGAVAALKDEGLKPGQDVYITSIDWLPSVLNMIKKGEIAASMGGHYMEGAWAVIVAYDYKNGHDFAPVTGVDILSEMEMLHTGNIQAYEGKLGAPWEEIDFKKLTRTHNADFNGYNFHLLDLIAQ